MIRFIKCVLTQFNSHSINMSAGYKWMFMFAFCICLHGSHAQQQYNVTNLSSGTVNGMHHLQLVNMPKYTRQFTSSDSCHIRSTDPYLHNKIVQLLEHKVKLINYHLNFVNYSTNPLLVNSTWSYKADTWARVSSQHGQTLLSLAFNYGILSMMTLTFGVETMAIELEDIPYGCIAEMSEIDKINTVMFLLMRDFKEEDETTQTPKPDLSKLYNGNVITLVDDERVCHEIIKNQTGYAKFTDRCCHIDRITDKQVCATELNNIWLSILYALLACIKFSMLFFGPLMFIPMIETIAKENIPYVVKLKEPLLKKILLVKADTPLNYTFKKVLDLRRVKGFPKFKKAAEDLPLGEPVKIKISQYDILVGYKRLMIENKVPVGVIRCLSRTIFQCRLKDMGPFKDCCQTDVMRSCDSDYEVLWIDIWQKIARVLLLLLLPTPFYLRLLVFYFYEYPEVLERDAAIYGLGLDKPYEGNLMHYLNPTHPAFITMYVLYFCTAGTLAFIARTNEKGKFNKIILGSFQDLKNLSWINAFGMVTSNIIWPFHRFGLVGCIVAILYWPIAIPISLIICLFYCLPSIYITFRMLIHSRKILSRSIFQKRGFDDGTESKASSKYAIRKEIDKSISVFETGALLNHISPANTLHQDGFREYIPRTVQIRRVIEHIFVSTLCILTMFAILIIMSECVGFVVELIVFTMMGVIVNAGSVLKYTTLLFLVLLYSYDTYNNVEKKYIKLNKSLFSEVKGRIKDIEEVTSLPSYLQENRGFKSQELSEQADYEQPDDVADEAIPKNWLINDLVLFIDNEDMPRIPTQLFEDVCTIRVAGAPGPIYLSLLEATKSFMMIIGFLFFVFLVVLSFGEVYQVSTTNQMLATLAGGFLPFILKTFMQPNKPDIELGTVSFKSKMDEIIKNFYQNWPMYDFPFMVSTEEDENASIKDEEGPPCINGVCTCQTCTCNCKRIRETSTQTGAEEIKVPEFYLQHATPNPSRKSMDDVSHATAEPGPSTVESPRVVSEREKDGTNETLKIRITDPSPSVTPYTSTKLGSDAGNSQSAVLSPLVPPKVSVTLSKDPVMPPVSRKISLPTPLTSKTGLNVPASSKGEKKPPAPKLKRRQTAPMLDVPDHGITTIVSIPLGTPNMGRRPTSPEALQALNNHGITTVRHHNLKTAATQNKPSIPEDDTSDFTKSPKLKRSMTNPLTLTEGIQENLVPKSSKNTVENLPVLDPNQNVRNFLNSATDFKSWQGSKSNLLTPDNFTPRGRKDSIRSNVSAMDYQAVRDMSLDEEDEDDDKIDLLVFLPEHPDNDLWLKEWSDMDQYEKPEDDLELGTVAASVVDEVFK